MGEKSMLAVDRHIESLYPTPKKSESQTEEDSANEGPNILGLLSVIIIFMYVIMIVFVYSDSMFFSKQAPEWWKLVLITGTATAATILSYLGKMSPLLVLSSGIITCLTVFILLLTVI